MSFFQSLLTDPSFDIIWIIGDSIARGNSDAVGTTPATNTVYQWDNGNSNLRMITNLDLLEPVAAGAIGSQWPDAGIYYHNRTKRKPVFVNCAIGGSAWKNANPDFSWAPTDNLYPSAVTKLNNCLNFLGEGAPKYIYINLGINDVLQGAALSQTNITDVVTQINTDFPDVRILYSMPDSPSISTLANYDRLFTIRKWLRNLQAVNSNWEIAGDMAPFRTWGSTYQADNIHLTAGGNFFFGRNTWRGALSGSTLHKYARSIIGLLYDNVSTTRQGWIDTYITDLETAGLLYEFDQLFILGGCSGVSASTDYKNIVGDWSFLNIGWTLLANAQSKVFYDGFKPDGLADDQRFASGQYNLVFDKSAYATDFITGFFLANNATPASTNSAPMGARENAAGGIIRLRQTGSNQIGFYAGSTTETIDATETRFAAGAHYATVRSSGNQILIKNSTIVNTAAVASTALNPGSAIRPQQLGCYNDNGTISLRFAGTFTVWYLARYSTFNVSDFITITNSFLTNWLTDVD